MFRFSSSGWQRFCSCCSLPFSGDEGKPGNDFRRVIPVLVILAAPLGAFLSEWTACSWSKPEAILAGSGGPDLRYPPGASNTGQPCREIRRYEEKPGFCRQHPDRVAGQGDLYRKILVPCGSGSRYKWLDPVRLLTLPRIGRRRFGRGYGSPCSMELPIFEPALFWSACCLWAYLTGWGGLRFPLPASSSGPPRLLRS